MAGVYLNDRLWLNDQGELYQLTNTMNGLGDVNWEKIGDFSESIFDKIIQFKAAGKPKPVPVPVQTAPAGVQVGGGLFGMDTTTLLLIGLAAFLFMSQPAKK